MTAASTALPTKRPTTPDDHAFVESYVTPSLDGSNLVSDGGLVMETDEDDAHFVREVVRIQWRPDDPIDLYVIRPTGVQKPPVILYLQTFPSETDAFLKADFCRALTDKGFAVVGFVSALTGQRYHSRPMKEWFVSELREALTTSAHDVQMILTYLSTRGDMDMNRVGMFGDGSGASIAILAAGVDRRIRSVDLLEPWGDWPQWMQRSSSIPEKERQDYLKTEFQGKIAPLDPLEWLPKLTTPAIRVQFVETDTVTSAPARQKLEAAVPKRARVVHLKDRQALARANPQGIGLDWLKNALQPDFVHDYSAHESQNGAISPEDNTRQR